MPEPIWERNLTLGLQLGRHDGVVVDAYFAPAAVELLHIAIHETYPGHQAERAAKEQLLVRVRDLAR